MISAWARMCKIIGPAFVEYLPHIIRPLIQAASVKPEIAIVDCELVHVMCYCHRLSSLALEAEQNFSEEDGWEFITLADQVSTSTVSYPDP